MIIATKFFGEVDIKDEYIINFKEGLFGFEDLKKYVLLDADNQGMFKCLQSLDYPDVAFIAINPWDVLKDYEMDIDDEQLEAFDDKGISNLLVYSILTITDERMTANLMAPVIINVKTQQGKQVVLYKSKYTTKHIIKELAKRED